MGRSCVAAGAHPADMPAQCLVYGLFTGGFKGLICGADNLGLSTVRSRAGMTRAGWPDRRLFKPGRHQR